jgi:hypothetical protein
MAVRASDVFCTLLAVTAVAVAALCVWAFGFLQAHMPQEPACKLHRQKIKLVT